MTIPDTIKLVSDKIRNSIYGKDVRESLASGIEQISEMSSDTQAQQDILEALYNEQLKNSNQLSEVNDAHVSGNNGATYTTIGKRFDNVELLLVNISAVEPSKYVASSMWYQITGETV
jgi:hypothetical protein